MKTLRARTAAGVLTVLALLPFARSAVPDYKLGDVVREDLITPVPLIVANPEATEALKQKVAQQVPFIVRQTTVTAGEAEADLRKAVATARNGFLSAFQRDLGGRRPAAADLDDPAYARVLREFVTQAPKDLPLDRLAPLWVRGASDDPVVESLLQPLREVMVQPIVNAKTEGPLAGNQSVRLMLVKNLEETPTVQEMENSGQTVTAGKVISLWRARRLVETSFATGQEAFGRFSASFVRPNAYPEPGLTEILRAKRLEGVTVNDNYAAAQVVVQKGQTVDHKALNALALLREKSLIGTLQTKLEQEQSFAGQIKKQTKWIAAILGVVCLALVLILWSLRSRPNHSLLPVLANPVPGDAGAQALPGGASDSAWRDRAMIAEGKAERAHEAIRSGAMGLMREKVFQSLSSQRAELLSAQQKAEAEMRELEQRLEQLHAPLQERITAYEKRIEDLEKELALKGEENRELIGARITVAKQQLNVERERGRLVNN